MKELKKECFWTVLKILILDEIKDSQKVVKEVFDFVDKFEAMYSRFRKWNYIYNLNKNKFWFCTDELKSMIILSQKISQITNWNFDITIGSLLENAWYWIFDEKINENTWYENININWNFVFLENNINIDLGWVWKWYTIDVIFDILKNYSNEFIINFGWDIKISGKGKFYLEDPLREWKQIWETALEDCSLAGSWQNKRRWHILNPKNWKSVSDKKAVFVKHKLASFADCLATGIFASPISEIDDILKKVPWLEILIISKDWKILESKNFKSKLWIW